MLLRDRPTRGGSGLRPDELSLVFSMRTLSASDREVIAQGLNALLRERTTAYEIATKVAVAQGHAPPKAGYFGFPDNVSEAMIHIAIGSL
ncbi:hypothetical protein EOS_33905 [Caballeronia mineralivorans PML1(12)]|uniref:Uncharacterized protein n=1 Tax=Caballeronia mineralivorans PML1(12) TaxID=908627 RepID=A0A0J1FPZ1_9BURK|nr:hypothetical protein EOS_33905 [Caballeronia mineralivorans PML1(12)]